MDLVTICLAYLGFNMLIMLIDTVMLFFIYKFNKKNFEKMCKPSKYSKKVWYRVWSKTVEVAFFPVFILVHIFDIWYKERAFYED